MADKAIIVGGERHITPGQGGLRQAQRRDPVLPYQARPCGQCSIVHGDVAWAAPDVLARLPHAESVYFDTVSQMVVDRWSRGRAVLLGDAAWCVTSSPGQGPYAPADLLRLWLRDLPLRFASYRPVPSFLQRHLQLKA